MISLLSGSMVQFGAIGAALAQVPPAQVSSADAPVDDAPSTQNNQHLIVHLELVDTQLDERAIRDALAEEFQIAVSFSERSDGLTLKVRAHVLSVSFKNEDGSILERQLDLPEDRSQQLTTIALLSGSIARDETGALIARLRAPAILEESPVDADNTESNPANDTAPPQEPAPAPNKAPETDDVTKKPRLEETFGSLSFVGRLTIPKKLEDKTSHAHLGFLSSDVGSLKGVAATLGIHINRGSDRDGSGQGVQAAVVYLQNNDRFSGVNASALVASNLGQTEGVLAGGLVTLCLGATQGLQISGLASIGTQSTRGAQLAGLSSLQTGNIKGVQAAGLTAYTHKDITGMQMAGLVSIAGGQLSGGQLAGLGAYAQQMSGYQMALVNVAGKRLDGVQLGLINIAGDSSATRIGLINVGRNSTGTQIGLLNVARDHKGAAIAPLNIIPKIRNQVLVYGSYFPTDEKEGSPDGPLAHLAIKFLPGAVYTQIGLGIGAESKECVASEDSNDDTCYGDGIVYAPSFALGVRSQLSRLFHIDVDAMYQYVRGFNQSRSSTHQIAGRAAFGLQPLPALGFFVGAGPQLELREGPRVEAPPEVSFGWNGFAGLAFF